MVKPGACVIDVGIHRMPDGSFFLSRYEDCAAVYRDAASWMSGNSPCAAMALVFAVSRSRV